MCAIMHIVLRRGKSLSNGKAIKNAENSGKTGNESGDFSIFPVDAIKIKFPHMDDHLGK